MERYVFLYIIMKQCAFAEEFDTCFSFSVQAVSAWLWVLVDYFNIGHSEVIVHHRN